MARTNFEKFDDYEEVLVLLEGIKRQMEIMLYRIIRAQYHIYEV